MEVARAGAKDAAFTWPPWRFDCETKWACAKCSFENAKVALHCEICGDARREDLDGYDALQYQIKYGRHGRSLDPWRYSAPVTQCEIELSGLERDTEYVATLRYRLLTPRTRRGGGLFSRRKASADPPWVEVPGGKVVFRTLSKDHSARVDTLDRVRAFLKGVMEPFPEAAARPDTYVDKATRVGEKVLTAAGAVGVGGKWAILAREAYRMKKSGMAGFVFREDLHRMVIALTSYVGQVGREYGLSNMDITLGSYYMIWEAKRGHLLNPDLAREAHTADQPGVLQESASRDLLDEMSLYFAFSQVSYRPSAPEVQWVLRQFPEKGSGYQLLACRSSSDNFRPAFSLMGCARTKVVVLAVRGTKEADDWVTDFACEYEEIALSFGKAGATPTTCRVHAGMLRAARWMLRGEDEPGTPPDEARPTRRRDADLHAGAGAGLREALLELHRAGYRVTLCGHSLGAGVATLMALLLAEANREITLDVYGYGSPACVDETLAEALKGADKRFHAAGARRITGLSGRVAVYNFVRGDDLVSRLSLFNARLFAAEIHRAKPRWQPLLEQDKGAYKSKAKSLWAPERRSNQRLVKRPVDAVQLRGSISRVFTSGSEPELEEGEDAVEDAVEEARLRKRLQQDPQRLVLAGVSLHAYRWRGAMRLSLIDYRFEGLRTIQASESLIYDHRVVAIHEAIRDVRAVMRLGRALSPPQWQSIEDHHNQGLYVNCGVCDFFVGWHLTGTSEAVEIRATHHCFACGKIVCTRCSTRRCALPEHGMVAPVRVCDVCFCRINLSG